MLSTQKSCETCHYQLLETYYFCPNCGRNLKPTPLPTGFIKQLGIYTVSILLPPFGLWPAFKYLKEKNNTAKIIGIIAILLTIISAIVSTILLKSWVAKINDEVNIQLMRYGY